MLRCFPVKRPSPRSLLTTVKYKIGNNSKTKNRTKKTQEYKNPIQNIAHLLRCPKTQIIRLEIVEKKKIANFVFISFRVAQAEAKTRQVLGFEKLSDNNFSFPSHPLHNYSFPFCLKLT